jgi:drug/metabolite transporter (DMT)-like permease
MKTIMVDNDPRQTPTTGPDRGTILAFTALVFLIAANVVAVRLTNRELPPFWGAGIRFVAASFLFFLYASNRRLALPRGRALAGVILFGVLQFGVGFALIYWALQKVPAGLASVILASVPLFTLLFAFLARLEPFRLRGLAGSLAAVAGIAVMFGERAGQEIPSLYLLAAVATAAVFAMAPVVVKSYPPVHLAITNGLGMLTGAVLLLALSFVYREEAAIPRQAATWAAYLYLVLPGSVGVFGLLLYVLKRWTATAVSYQAVLSPIVAIGLSAWLLGEPVTGGLFVGSVLVLAGVYIGALSRF